MAGDEDGDKMVNWTFEEHAALNERCASSMQHPAQTLSAFNSAGLPERSEFFSCFH